MPKASASSGAMGSSTSTAVSTATAVIAARDSPGGDTVSCSTREYVHACVCMRVYATCVRAYVCVCMRARVCMCE
eukprot:1158068-Pelagomonas_calceolata.AAC.3